MELKYVAARLWGQLIGCHIPVTAVTWQLLQTGLWHVDRVTVCGGSDRRAATAMLLLQPSRDSRACLNTGSIAVVRAPVLGTSVMVNIAKMLSVVQQHGTASQCSCGLSRMVHVPPCSMSKGSNRIQTAESALSSQHIIPNCTLLEHCMTKACMLRFYCHETVAHFKSAQPARSSTSHGLLAQHSLAQHASKC